MYAVNHVDWVISTKDVPMKHQGSKCVHIGGWNFKKFAQFSCSKIFFLEELNS